MEGVDRSGNGGPDSVLLEGSRVTMHFAGLVALSDVDFFVRRGEIVALIGPNGAGKSTLFNVITGLYAPVRGKLLLNGTDITGLKPYRICHLGVGRTFQTPRVFPEMSVQDCVALAAIYGKGRPPKKRDAYDHAAELLDFVGLHEAAHLRARSLSPVKRKVLEVAMALATGPDVLLIDELMAGLNPTETLGAMSLITRIRDMRNITVFWIEHVMKAVMEVVERIVVLHHGMKIAEGLPREIARDERVLEAYLGKRT